MFFKISSRFFSSVFGNAFFIFNKVLLFDLKNGPNNLPIYPPRFDANLKPKILKRVVTDFKENDYSTIFGYRVNDPERYGVVQFDNNRNVISLICFKISN